MLRKVLDCAFTLALGVILLRHAAIANPQLAWLENERIDSAVGANVLEVGSQLRTGSDEHTCCRVSQRSQKQAGSGSNTCDDSRRSHLTAPRQSNRLG